MNRMFASESNGSRSGKVTRDKLVNFFGGKPALDLPRTCWSDLTGPTPRPAS
jgi:hypothetical protein